MSRQKMNEKERIKNCINFKYTDKIPWQIGYTGELAKKIMKALKIKEEVYPVLGKNIYAYINLDNFLGNHITFLRNRAVNGVKEVQPGIWKDEWNVLWDRKIDKDIGTPVNCLLEDMNMKMLKVPDPLDEARFAHFQPLIEANLHRYILVKFSYCLFERAWSLRGMENLLMDFIVNPGFVHELFTRITDYHIAIIKAMDKYQVDGIYFGDDWGSQRGLLMSPDTWRTFMKSYLKRMYDQAHSQGYDVFIHTCGDISLILDDFVEIGVNVYNPFQPEVMNIEKIIQKYSHHLAFYGGLSIQRTLPFGTPENIRKKIEHRLVLASTYGGYIISPSHDMPPDIPVENILTMIDALA